MLRIRGFFKFKLDNAIILNSIWLTESCENEKLEKILSFAIKQGTKELINQYNNWGKLLAPAPVAIGILGQLILMANHRVDFPVNREDPEKVFKYIKYPESFRATLLQISQQGYVAFLKAYNNMNAIRLHSSTVPGDIKDVVRYLMSNNTKVIKLRLPSTLARIEKVAKKSQELSKEVVNEFHLVLSLIHETEKELALISQKTGSESRVYKTKILMEKQAKEFSDKEQLILNEKNAKMNEMMDKLEYSNEYHYNKVIYNDVSFIIELTKREIGHDRYKEDTPFLHDRQRQTRVMKCATKNIQQIFIALFARYRINYKHWHKINNQLFSIYDGSKFIIDLEGILERIQLCPDVDNIIKKGSDFVKKLKSPNAFQPNNRTSEPPYLNEIEEIQILVIKLRPAAFSVIVGSDKQNEIVSKRGWEIYFTSKQQQFNQLNNTSKTLEDIVKLNNNLTEIRRQKTKLLLDRIVNLNINKVLIEEVIYALKLGLNEMGQLKNDWENLIEFFVNIDHLIEETSRNSTGLIEIIETMTPSVQMKEIDQILFEELLDSLKQSNNAIFLVHGIADMYAKVSDLFIMSRMTCLNKMNLMMFDNATDEQLEQEKAKLSDIAKQASEGIEAFFYQQTKQLNETLQFRHQEIFKEYEQLFACIEKNGLIDRAINFTDDNRYFIIYPFYSIFYLECKIHGLHRFQLKSRLNEKLLEVPSGNNRTVRMCWNSHGNKDNNQLWYLDKEKIIRSLATDDCLTSQGKNL